MIVTTHYGYRVGYGLRALSAAPLGPGHLDDLVGSCISLYLLPLAGAESAVALALLVAFRVYVLY